MFSVPFPQELQRHGAKNVVRVCDPTYSKEKLENEGIDVLVSHLGKVCCVPRPVLYLDLTKPFINPFSALSCKISGLNDARYAPANSIFSGPVTQLLSALCILMKLFSRASEKNKTESLKGFIFCTFIGLLWQMTLWQ